MYTKAYHIFLKVLGPHHPETQGLKPFVPSVPAVYQRQAKEMVTKAYHIFLRMLGHSRRSASR